MCFALRVLVFIFFVNALKKFNVIFTRHALCTLLSLHDRLDWKACAQSESEERADAERFKGAFGPFDTVQSG